MKKLTLAALVATSIMATSAFAEDPVEVVSFNGQIINNIDGDVTAITGLNGGAVVDGAIKVEDDGSFTTTQSIVLEHHLRDSGGTDTTAILPDLVAATTWDVPQLRYYVNNQQVYSSTLTLNATDGKGAAASDPLAEKAEYGSTTSNPLVGTTTDQSKITLTVTGTALTDASELRLTPGINDVQVLATITAKAITL